MDHQEDAKRGTSRSDRPAAKSSDTVVMVLME